MLEKNDHNHVFEWVCFLESRNKHVRFLKFVLIYILFSIFLDVTNITDQLHKFSLEMYHSVPTVLWCCLTEA